MSDGHRRIARRLVSGLVLVLAVGLLGGAAEAAVGDVLWTVNIPGPTDPGGGAQCDNGSGTLVSGTAVAVVPGGKLNFPKFQTLLVTSCVRAGQAKLFFLDPSTNPAKLVSTINTSVTPTNGWEALALRSDKIDLIGCGMVGGMPKVYSIDFSSIAPNTVNDGTASLLFTETAAGATCQGLVWDVIGGAPGELRTPKTIYQSSPGASPNVLHLTEAGTSSTPANVPSGCPGTMTGVAVGVASAASPVFSGSVLFVACPQSDESIAEIRQIKRADGALVTSTELPLGSFDLLDSLGMPISQPGDIECDPVTFALSQSWHAGIRNKDVLWVKDAGTVTPHKVYAMELPFAACGPVPPPPTPAALACPTGSQDTDGDGLPDCWEDNTWWNDNLPGIALDGVYQPGRTPTTTNRFTLCVNGTTDCATKLQRDVFVEIDYMQFHRPDANAVGDVVTAFMAAPAFASGSGKCDTFPLNGCTGGIRLHVQVDDEQPITHVDNTALIPCTGPKVGSDADFDTIKTANFGTSSERSNVPLLNAKRLAYHYGLWVHNQSPPSDSTTSSSSGCAELFGNDFMVSLGSWTPPNPQPTGHSGGVGSRTEQAGTFMHELGHNLGLRHGGVDNVNCKPHHLSVMNYWYQFTNTATDRPLSYSPLLGVTALTCNGLPPPGSQLGLNEGCLNEQVGIGTLYTGNIAYGPLSGAPPKPTVVKAGGAINWNNSLDRKGNPTIETNVISDLNFGSTGCPQSPKEFLEGSNDWQILQLNLRASADFADGVSLNADPPVPNGTTVDMQFETLLDLSLDTIQIKRNDNNTTINLGTTGTFNVTMFSRIGTGTRANPEVDATTINPLSITLRGILPAPPGTQPWSLTVRNGNDCTTQDVNKDGAPDFVCKFTWQPGPVVNPGTQRAVLSGTGTIFPSGHPASYDFLGSDNIRFVN